jgi:16S rRNA (cytosine967-C5)-methyltransferase
MKKGGVLYYSTCSLEREENEEVIKEFLTLGTGFSISDSGVDQRFVTPDGFMRTYPDRDGTDGFFLAILRRDQ